MQMLWDRGENNGYAQHIVGDPLPGTPDHKVLMHAAIGDHQVTTIQADVLARTIGASVRQPAIDRGPLDRAEAALRHPRDRELPVHGRRRDGLLGHGPGPHRERRDRRHRARAARRGARTAPAGPARHARARTRTAQRQKVEFLLNGRVIDVCGQAQPCYVDGWTGP